MGWLYLDRNDIINFSLSTWKKKRKPFKKKYKIKNGIILEQKAQQKNYCQIKKKPFAGSWAWAGCSSPTSVHFSISAACCPAIQPLTTTIQILFLLTLVFSFKVTVHTLLETIYGNVIMQTFLWHWKLLIAWISCMALIRTHFKKKNHVTTVLLYPNQENYGRLVPIFAPNPFKLHANVTTAIFTIKISLQHCGNEIATHLVSK